MAVPNLTVEGLHNEISRLERDVDDELRCMSAEDRRTFAPLLSAAVEALKAQAPSATGLPNVLTSPGSEAFSTPWLPSLISPRLRSQQPAAEAMLPGPSKPVKTPKPPGASVKLTTPRGREGSPRHHAAGEQSSLTLGQALAAGLFLLTESLQVRTQASRLTVVLKNPTGGLVIAADCGGPQRKLCRATKLPLKENLLRSVMDTGMAASLPTVSLEDIEDREAARPRNVLALPVPALSPKVGYVGVIIAVNGHAGTRMFTESDERVLFAAAPSISYLTQTYEIDYVAYAMDPAPLHRYAPLPVASASDGGDAAAALLASMMSSLAGSQQLQQPEPPAALVFRREGQEKFVRKEHLKELASPLPVEGDETHLVSVTDHIERIERAWAAAIERCMISERTLRQKQAMVADAVEILARKQRKVDLLKDVLSDNLKTPEELERDAVRAAAGAAAVAKRPGISFRSALAGSGATGPM